MSDQDSPPTAAPAPADYRLPMPREEMHPYVSHEPELVQNRSIRAGVQGGGVLGRWNAAIALRITKVVGTMYCAYVFTLLALVALPSAIQSGNPTVLVNWLSSNFLQLVLLPIIIVGQNVISEAQDKRAEADHKTLTALHKMNVQQLRILHQQDVILHMLQNKAQQA
ncbi:MAG: hypothetical protein ABR598_07915 [Candidatus Dormibacteria bacterium]